MGCGSTPIKYKQTNSIDYVDLSTRFDLFWKRAKDKPLYQRLELWDEIIEGRYTDLYNTIIWTDPNPLFSKKVDLWAAFELYDKHASKISKFSTTIQDEVDKARETYIREYPDSIIYGSIYVMPLGPRRSTSSMLTSDANNKAKYLMLINSDTISLAPDQMQNILINKLTHFNYIANPNIVIKSFDGKISFSRLLLISGLGEFNIAKLVKIKPNYQQNKTIVKIHQKMKNELSEFKIDVFDLPPQTNYACERNFLGREESKNYDCTKIPEISLEFVKFLRKKYSYQQIFNFDEAKIQASALKFLSSSPNFKDLRALAKLSNL
jgi:hypothetical protein